MPRQRNASVAPDEVAPRARLHKLVIRNFRAIGKSPVEIELDDIVVLVGNNNTGKSSILRAYQLVMETGKGGDLELDDFPGGKMPSSEDDWPTIELETVLFPDSRPPADKWIEVKPNNDRHVRERWMWSQPGPPIKRGFNQELGRWDASHGPWGVASVAQPNRPAVHRIEAFDDPQGQANNIIKLLQQAISDRVKELSAQKQVDGKESHYGRLLSAVQELQVAVADEAMKAVDNVRAELSDAVAGVFPGFQISLDARPQDDVERSLSLFKAPPVLRMGPEGGHQSDLDRQGSGARRTLLWTALKILADHKQVDKDGNRTGRPQVLLLDEPELCLHPSAIRDACRVLYSLPEGRVWQVMVTTHSPAFIDVSRDNTSIVRVERNVDGGVSGTTIFRPRRAELSEDDKERLKLLNMYDPYVAEFFFGGRTVVVEGDTEFSAFREVMSEEPDRFRDVHVVRARGKYTIVSLCKILNQFGCPYAVLHDADTSKLSMDGVSSANSAWTANGKILAEVSNAQPGAVRLVASVHNFEQAMFGGVVKGEKPYSAWLRVRSDPSARSKLIALLEYLIGTADQCPDGVIPWSSEDELMKAVSSFEPA